MSKNERTDEQVIIELETGVQVLQSMATKMAKDISDMKRRLSGASTPGSENKRRGLNGSEMEQLISNHRKMRRRITA